MPEHFFEQDGAAAMLVEMKVLQCALEYISVQGAGEYEALYKVSAQPAV